LGGAALFVMVGCQPVHVRDDPTRSDVTVDVSAEGDIDVELLLAPEHAGDLVAMAYDVGLAMFPTAQPEPSIDENGAGYDFARLHVHDVYQPGPSPRVRFPTTGLRDALAARGVSFVRLSVCGPPVPTRFAFDVDPTERDRCYQWTLRPDTPAPEITLSMRPSPMRWWLAVAETIVGVGGAIVAFKLLAKGGTTRRLSLLVAAASSFVAAGLGIATGAAAQGSNLGVAGYLHGVLLFAATVLPIVVLPAAGISFVLIIIAISHRPAPRPF